MVIIPSGKLSTGEDLPLPYTVTVGIIPSGKLSTGEDRRVPFETVPPIIPSGKLSTGEDKQRRVASGKKSRIRRLALVKLFQTHKASIQKSILGIRTKEAVAKAIAPHAPRNTGA